MKKRIVITGTGVVSPLGIGTDEYFSRLISKENGVSAISLFDTTDFPIKVAGEIKDFHPEDHLPKKLIRETDRFMQFAYTAADEALTSAQITSTNIGIVLGTALGGISLVSSTQDEYSRGIHTKISPRFIPKMLSNIGASQIAINKKLTGPCLTVSTACSSGGDAIMTAALLIQNGQAETMLCVGAESSICPLIMNGLASAHALSTNPDPDTASRPFDVNRDGFVMGEGAGAILLETYEHAIARNATIIGELVGYANNTDAYHVTSPHPDGCGAISCMQDALKYAEIQPSDIGYINTHGTSTKMGDTIECKAISNVFGDTIPYLNSTKSSTGHMMGAGGITEVITCLEVIRNQIIPPTLHYASPDPDCLPAHIADHVNYQPIEYAMSNAFGFGGQNSCIIVKKS